MNMTATITGWPDSCREADMKYLHMQIKRVWGAFPVILLTTLILAGVLATMAYFQAVSSSESEENSRITLALVGDTEDSYLGFGIDLLQKMDSSRYTCTLVKMTEEEAVSALERQEIYGYLVIPDYFVESVALGGNKKVTFVVGTVQYGIGAMLARELADCVSTLLTETQSGIYAFQRFAEQRGASGDLMSDIYEINIRYFQYVLPRAELYDIDTPDSSPVISIQGYYACAAGVLFLLFLGVSGGYLFIRGDLSMNRMLAVRGTGPARQVLAEYISCCFLFLLNYLVIMAVFLLLPGETISLIPELSGISWVDRVRLLFSFGLLIPVMASILYFLSQCVRSLISGVILIFFCAIGLGYLSGCFYPLSFFPEQMQRLASALPVGILMEYMQRILLGERTGSVFLMAAAWTVCLLVPAYLIRKKKLAG